MLILNLIYYLELNVYLHFRIILILKANKLLLTNYL